MTAMWVLVPSRGRPKNVARLVRACALTCTADTRLHFGFDQDDPYLDDSIAAAAGHLVTVLPRMGLAAWTNRLADEHVKTLPEHVPGALASIGDDMVPVTGGWDTELLGELDRMGGGFAYPSDGRRSDIPEACVISAAIVAALGWMALPSSSHWFIDNVWHNLGAPDRLAYRPDVVVTHKHPNTPGGDPHDQTYADAAVRLDKDLAAYQKWRLLDMRRDRQVVRDACRRPA